MKKIIIYVGIALGLIGPFFLTSCKKEEPIKAKTKTELLCASSWKIYEITVNPGVEVAGTVVTDLFALLEPCLQDDTYRYNNNGTGLHDEGPTKCIVSDPQSTPLTWTFNPSETQLIENNDNDNLSDIVQLDDKILKISQIKDGVDIGGIEGIKYLVTTTAKH